MIFYVNVDCADALYGEEPPVSLPLFVEKTFVGHSGNTLKWKVECGSMSDADWAWAARRVAEKFSFRDVYGIPKGGAVFERHLRQYIKPNGDFFLIVDDVLTTGNSMWEARKTVETRHPGLPRIGIVLFARETPASWITAIWKLWP